MTQRPITPKCTAILAAAAVHPRGHSLADTVSQADALRRAGYTVTGPDGIRVITDAGRAFIASR